MSNSPNATSYLSSPVSEAPESHSYVQPERSASRSPCPALNTLANHGYVQREGRDIGFFELIDALTHVYNVSYVLAFFLTIVGFMKSGHMNFSTKSTKVSAETAQPTTWSPWIPFSSRISLPRWNLDLGDLSIPGPKKIAHNASFVHPNFIASHAPDKHTLERFLSYATSCQQNSRLPGLSLKDLARYRQIRESELSSPLNDFHQKVALGECGLAWAVMRRRSSMARQASTESAQERMDVIPHECLQQWFGCEKLPSDWWSEGGSRPIEPIGLREAKRRADHVAKFMRN